MHPQEYESSGMITERMKNTRYYLLLMMPVPAFIISLFFGNYPISPGDVLQTLMTFPPPDEGIISTAQVLFGIRIPRILLAMVIGAALSVSGACFQGIFRNPLVSPDILGLSAGAAFGSALCVAFLGHFPIIISAFVFALIALGFAYLMAYQKGSTSVTALVLSGVITAAVFEALLTSIQFAVSERALQDIVFWTMGSLNTATWGKVYVTAPLIVGGSVLIYLMRWRLNVLALGDDDARALGMKTEQNKAIFIVIGSLVASVAVAAAGIIGLVGLIVPHVVRMVIGPDHRLLIPA